MRQTRNVDRGFDSFFKMIALWRMRGRQKETTQALLELRKELLDTAKVIAFIFFDETAAKSDYDNTFAFQVW